MKKDIKEKLNKLQQMIVSDKEFNDELRGQVKLHHNYFNNGDKDGLTPQLVIQCHVIGGGFPQKRQWVIMLLGIDNFENKKYEAFFNAGAKLAEERKLIPMMVFMSSEAWARGFSTNDKEGKEAMSGKKKVSDFADKTEVLVTTGMTLDQRTNAVFIEMKRITGNNIMLGKEKYQDYDPKDPNKMQSNLLLEFYKGFAYVHAHGGKSSEEFGAIKFDGKGEMVKDDDKQS